ncbi:MAG: transcription termination factor Rho [Clostridiaceae bacterium]|jgi:transcription termination factor Rho|nr:transcription termination factor Rho [Clostridiaceae bacterium]
MPSFNTEGKSKEDLVIVAQLAGLLSFEDASRMTRTQLVKIIDAENEKTAAQEMEILQSSAGVKKTTRGRKPKAEAAKEAETAQKDDAEPQVTKKRVGRPPSASKAAAKKKEPTKDKVLSKADAVVSSDDKAADDTVDKPVVKKAAPRKTAKKTVAKKETSTAKDSPEPTDGDQAAVAAAPEDIQPADQVAASDAQPPASPESAEAVADKETPTDSRRRTLKTVRPNQRRVRVIGPTNENTADQAENQRLKQSSKTILPDHPETEISEQDSPEQVPGRSIVEAGDVQAGVLEIMPDGYGFLRKENYLQGNRDIYVPPQYIRRFGLRPGDYISGPVKLQRENDRYQALLYIKEVNGQPPEKMLRRPHFDRLTPIYPDQRFVLETTRNELSTRIIDLVAPIGKGQRGMIVSPPKAGKTILLQKIANAISINNPEAKLIVLLIDERPEEVTDMQRSIKGEVVYSTFDKTPENHTKVTELVLERAMRLVELKEDVVILLDSMTRLARAYNLSINPTGRTLSGGLDPGALYGPKRFFGAARNIEHGGSLTIIATSLIETGSRMDEVIFEEFKGTGNMEVYLDRKMSEKRIFPAIDINKSGTRREELLMSTKELDAVWTIRKAFGQLDSAAVTEAIISLLLKTTSNPHFISSVNVSFNDKNVFEAMRGVRPSETGQNNRNGTGQNGYGW